MSFDSVERSVEGRAPVELWTFFRSFQTWRYTSADRDINFGGFPYLARSIARSSIESSAELARGTLRVTVPRDLEVADLYRVAPPTVPVTCTLQQYHDGDGAAIMLWSGRITSVAFRGVAAEIAMEPVFTSMRRVGLRRLYQRQCPHVLYGPACNVNAEAVRLTSIVDAISGATVTVPAASLQASGWYAGGYLEYEPTAGIPERRFITDHVGGSLTLTMTPAGLTVGMTVKVYPGCDHTLATCSGKFSNAANFGGFPFMPTKNPFDGSPLY
jgi:uncharacterized phage protein (TIGR02218 family)